MERGGVGGGTPAGAGGPARSVAADGRAGTFPALDPAARVGFLDGMRGTAITLVVLYHAYVRWEEVVPFGDRYAAFPPFAHGWLGVQLFFMLSGFVILMTLERCGSLGGFAWRRWLRLFPAMLACSALVYATAPLLPERPMGMPGPRDLLPGLLFLEPDWLAAALGRPQGELEGAFWSLFVEVKFYAIFGALFFLVGPRVAVAAVILLFTLFEAMTPLAAVPGLAGEAKFGAWLLGELGAEHFGWFGAGALFYLYWRDRTPVLAVAAAAVGVAAALLIDADWDPHARVAALAVPALFCVALLSARARAALSHRALVFLGFVSYPLYLLHENMVAALTAQLGAAAPWLPGFLLPVAPIALAVLLAWVVAARVEPPLRGWLGRLALAGGPWAAGPRRRERHVEDGKTVAPVRGG